MALATSVLGNGDRNAIVSGPQFVFSFTLSQTFREVYFGNVCHAISAFQFRKIGNSPATCRSRRACRSR